jgi:thioredoxin 1
MDNPELAAIRARKLEKLLAERAAAASALTWSGPIHLTDATFEAEIRKPGLILVDFWAPWCGPCLRVAPLLEDVAKERIGRLRLGKLNVDDNPSTPARFGIMSIPTMLLFKDGKLVDGIVGAVPRAQIEAAVTRWT